MIVGITFKHDMVALLVVEHHRGNHLAALDFHNLMKIVISAGARDEMWNRRCVREFLCESLIVVDVPRKNHIGMPAGFLGGSLDDSFHIGAARMMIIGGINRMMQ